MRQHLRNAREFVEEQLRDAEAAPKPALGEPCNGCGVCCLTEPCPVGMLVSRKRRGACAALRWEEETSRYRCGVVIGSGIGGIETIEEQNKILNARGVRKVSPFTVPRLMANAGSGNVSILYHLYGPNTTVATACACIWL